MYSGKRDLLSGTSADLAQKRLKAVLVGVGALVTLLVLFSCFGPTPSDSGFHCWIQPTSYLDPQHKNGFRTISRHPLDSNYVIIQGRNSAHGGVAATFAVHGTIERGGRTLVADFSAVGGPPRLHGYCAANGDIKWVDGNTWYRGVRLSEIIAGGVYLASQAAEAIRRAHHSALQLQNRDATETDGQILRIKDVTDEGVGEPVTPADKASNRVLVSGYQQRFPGVEILTEEAYEAESQRTSTKEVGTDDIVAGMASAPLPEGFHLDFDPVFAISDLLVLVDPLDATKEFTEGLTQYVTTQQCVVLRRTGRPVAAVLHQPFSDALPTVALPPLPPGSRFSPPPPPTTSPHSEGHSGSSSNNRRRHQRPHRSTSSATSLTVPGPSLTRKPESKPRANTTTTRGSLGSGGRVFGGMVPFTPPSPPPPPRRRLSVEAHSRGARDVGGSSGGRVRSRGAVAALGGGAARISQRWLRSNPNTTSAPKFVAVSRSHSGDAEDVVKNLFDGYTPLKAGGAGYKALLVLQRRAQGYLHTTKSKAWDACAADALVHALGGRFTDVTGAALEYSARDPVLRRGLLGAAAPSQHAWFVERLTSTGTAPAAAAATTTAAGGGGSSSTLEASHSLSVAESILSHLQGTPGELPPESTLLRGGSG